MLRSDQGKNGYKGIVTIEVIDNKAERDSLVERVEVLERVKQLLLLPELEIATTQQVARFYGVDHNTLKLVVHHNRGELESDGMKHMKYGEIKELINLTLTVDSMKELGIGKVGSNIFPKRAILRVGMLLRDSEVAKEVRTQLLNIEENTAIEVKTYEIDYEQEVLGQGFKVYGTMENPLFLAKDVAEWIEHSHITTMLNNVDEDEKLSEVLIHAGQKREMMFLTEDGIYEVLMTSRKPIAKQWKKEVELPEEGSSFVRSLEVYPVSYFET
ncbi:BRO-N domain-containing protein [Bacillus paramycoides]|uniref:BRO-N domain-containing protein n=1 Tax=Bacillus paramycoides TaxID=2026194 RepID=UPI003D02F01C